MSHTTCCQKAKESHGRDYYFIDDITFERATKSVSVMIKHRGCTLISHLDQSPCSLAGGVCWDSEVRERVVWIDNGCHWTSGSTGPRLCHTHEHRGGYTKPHVSMSGIVNDTGCPLAQEHLLWTEVHPYSTPHFTGKTQTTCTVCVMHYTACFKASTHLHTK